MLETDIRSKGVHKVVGSKNKLVPVRTGWESLIDKAPNSPSSTMDVSSKEKMGRRCAYRQEVKQTLGPGF